jgi:hypothetical protein
MTHKIIHTPDYLLVVDDSEIKEGDYCIMFDDFGNLFGSFPNQYLGEEKGHYLNKGLRKVISHLPLNNSPILEGVALLPPFEQEDDVERLAEEYGENIGNKNGTAAFDYKRGYNKAKEKYNYTEEDIRKAMAMGFDWCHQKYIPDDLMIDNFIQYLSQPKMPVWIKCEIQQLGSQTEGYYEVPITTTNSQGQIVWVGKYIY